MIAGGLDLDPGEANETFDESRRLLYLFVRCVDSIYKHSSSKLQTSNCRIFRQEASSNPTTILAWICHKLLCRSSSLLHR